MTSDSIKMEYMSNRYVYILFDPRRGKNRDAVFYVGRGTGHRAGVHVDAARRGADPVDLLAIEQEEPQQDAKNIKTNTIQNILNAGENYTAKDMIRVVAQGLDVELSATIESFAIHHVFDGDKLANIQAGANAKRFRKYGDWESNEILLPDKSSIKPFGVYVLRNPAAGEDGVFYVGKGKGSRPEDHFGEAARALEATQQTDKIATLRALRTQFDPSQIVRVIATDLTEREAFAIESFSLKYVYGFGDAMTNRVDGHHAERFRAKDDWDLRLGFDLPFLVTGDGRLARRMEQDIMCGAGYDRCLMPVVNALPELIWDGPKIVGAGALAFITSVKFPDDGQGELHVFTFSGRAVQIELRGNGDAVPRHLRRFNYQCRRRDKVYFPDAWASKPTRLNVATEPGSNVAVERFRAMLALTQAANEQQLEQK